MPILQESYTDKIDVIGVVRRVYWFGLFINEDSSREWHYFGTDPADRPPYSAGTIFEHAYVQIPNDMDHLPADESEDIFQELGVMAGIHKEGLTE